MAKHQNIYLNVCPITPSSGAYGGPSTHSAAPAATTHDTSVDAATTPSPSPRRRRGPLSTRWGVPAHRGGGCLLRRLPPTATSGPRRLWILRERRRRQRRTSSRPAAVRLSAP